MPFSFADLKTRCRQMVHNTFAVSGLYAAPGGTTPPVSLSVRYHNKFATELAGDQTTVYLEGITSLVFDRGELATKALTLTKNAVVTLTDYGLSFKLQTKHDIEGPVNETWDVVKA